MTAQNTILAFTDAAADAVGREIARLRSEAKRENELRDAEYRARTAELENRIQSAAGLERDLRDRLATLKDGEPGKNGEPGKDAAPAYGVDDINVKQTDAIVEFAFDVGEVRYEYEIELPSGLPGEPGAPGKDAEPAKDGEPGKEGPPGKLTPAAPWVDEIHYEGAIRTHGGATYQALRDTAKEPPHEDWACLAERGADGRSIELRETWSADEEYKQLDVVTLNSSSFVARKDAPGECPGPDWKLLAGQGKRGAPGEPGKRGEPGPPGPPVKVLAVNDDGILTLENGDGSTVTCDLYPLLSKIDRKGI
jgi:hypothetical protein